MSRDRGPDPGRPPVIDSVLAGLGEILSRMEVEDAVRPGAHIRRDLGLDSLRRIELVIEVENRFRVRLEPEDEAEVETVGDLARVIRRRAGAASEGSSDAATAAEDAETGAASDAGAGPEDAEGDARG